mmetsp:Transcript_28843/g.74092  ORF Transcript_28843/g.74092 Transcript_28843/m.74092 type:complete len:331 (-) Transcript_28843:740-1732(-)
MALFPHGGARSLSHSPTHHASHASAPSHHRGCPGGPSATSLPAQRSRCSLLAERVSLQRSRCSLLAERVKLRFVELLLPVGQPARRHLSSSSLARGASGGEDLSLLLGEDRFLLRSEAARRLLQHFDEALCGVHFAELDMHVGGREEQRQRAGDFKGAQVAPQRELKFARLGRGRGCTDERVHFIPPWLLTPLARRHLASDLWLREHLEEHTRFCSEGARHWLGCRRCRRCRHCRGCRRRRRRGRGRRSRRGRRRRRGRWCGWCRRHRRRGHALRCRRGAPRADGRDVVCPSRGRGHRGIDARLEGHRRSLAHRPLVLTTRLHCEVIGGL